MGQGQTGPPRRRRRILRCTRQAPSAASAPRRQRTMLEKSSKRRAPIRGGGWSNHTAGTIPPTTRRISLPRYRGMPSLVAHDHSLPRPAAAAVAHRTRATHLSPCSCSRTAQWAADYRSDATRAAGVLPRCAGEYAPTSSGAAAHGAAVRNRAQPGLQQCRSAAVRPGEAGEPSCSPTRAPGALPRLHASAEDRGAPRRVLPTLLSDQNCLSKCTSAAEGAVSAGGSVARDRFAVRACCVAPLRTVRHRQRVQSSPPQHASHPQTTHTHVFGDFL